MSKDNKPKPHRTINQEHLMFSYLKFVFPHWEEDITQMPKVVKLIDSELMQDIISDMNDVTQECMQDETKIESRLIRDKAFEFRNANKEKLKQIQSQI